MTKDFYVDCRWGKAFVREYVGNTEETPVVALHGWLDNSASFSFLAPSLNRTVYCVDLPGHGLSSHQPPGNWYHFIDYVEKVREVILKLSDTKVILLGHSLGAAVSAILASSFPDQIEKLVMIDGIGPLVNSAEDTPENLRSAILKRSKVLSKKKRPFPSIEVATKLRRTVGELTKESAKALVTHQLVKKDDGYFWTYDSKLNFTSSIRMTPEQLMAFYNQLKCPALLIKATDGLLAQFPYEPYLQYLPNLVEIELSGHHHLHMDNPAAVAQEINDFL